MYPPPTNSTLFPYTTLFRSWEVAVDDPVRVGDVGPVSRRPAVRERRLLRAPRASAKRDRHQDRNSTRLNSSHTVSTYAAFCMKKKKKNMVNIDNSQMLYERL